MKIWKLDEDVNNYAMLTLPDEKNLLAFSKQFNSFTSLKDTWKPVNVKIFKSEQEKKIGDFFGMECGVWVFNKKALDVVKQFVIEGKSEILQLNGENEIYYLLNVFNHIDCIDLEKSKVVYFRDGIRVMTIDKYFFKVEKLIGEHIFKSTVQRRGPIFISEQVKDVIENAGLLGIKFELIWDSKADD